MFFDKGCVFLGIAQRANQADLGRNEGSVKEERKRGMEWNG